MSSEFYNEWFSNEKWWFNPTPEDDKYITDKYQHLLNNCENMSLIEKVIIYDQLPRHIYRNTDSNHIINYFLEKALRICDFVEPKDEYEWIFSKMPLRHTYEPIVIQSVMLEIWTKSDYIKKPIIRKFIKAMYTRCPKNQDLLVNEIMNEKPIDLVISISDYDEIFKKFRNNLTRLGFKKVILSFSGGVDSLICSVMLHNMPEIEWSAVHINYTNRKSHKEEENFVRDWCKYLGVNLYVRRIDEINRQPCMENELRELYETYTRNVRYNTYKYVGKDLPVILGHNSDDCIENILTNIAQQQKYEQLSGMSLYCVQDGIQFIRPLIDTSKDDIYKFAERYKLVHLPNSTPTWSQRGQIRNTVLPVLEKWDNRITTGLFKLDSHMSDLHKCVEILVNNMIANTESNELIFNEIPEIVLLWRMYIKQQYNIVASYKSLESFIDRVKYIKKRDRRVMIPIAKNLKVHIRYKYGEYSMIWEKSLL